MCCILFLEYINDKNENKTSEKSIIKHRKITCRDVVFENLSSINDELTNSKKAIIFSYSINLSRKSSSALFVRF